ncbi:MAG TPA: hypothetical protein VMH39_12140 [Gemmatimonadaceae bacterium]|nr:hypothetical protein [Gemmatimonadaceae bacterium]
MTGSCSEYRRLAHKRLAASLRLLAGGIGLPWIAASAQAAKLPPVRQLGPRLAITKDFIGNVGNVRQLSDGRLLVNDNRSHRLLLFDATLTHSRVIVDSVPAANRAYGSAAGGLIAYTGDSTIFVDPVALSLLVLDPAGRIRRVISAPVPDDAGSLVAPLGGAAFDGRGRLVYRPTGARYFATGYSPGNGARAPSRQKSVSADRNDLDRPNSAFHDSVPIVAGDMHTHRVDTLGFLSVPITWAASFAVGSDGSDTRTLPVTPVSVFDDWAVVSDGSIAFVRAQDYHIDWINNDGTHTSTPPLPHAWHRLSDSDKVALIDSARRQNDSLERVFAFQQARQDSIDRLGGVSRPKAVTIYEYPPTSDVPDYLPPFSTFGLSSAVRADRDDNLWIREGYAPPAPDGPPPIYDIVNRAGRLVDRVRLPATMTLAGFGHGVVYLSVREGGGTVLARYRVAP